MPITSSNQISDLKPLEKVTRISTLELTDNQITDVTPLTKQTEISKLMLQKNKITNLGPLVKWAKADADGATFDQIGWGSVSPKPDTGGFGFNLSLRQFLELRNYIDRGQKVGVVARNIYQLVVLAALYLEKENMSRDEVREVLLEASDEPAGNSVYDDENEHTEGKRAAKENASPLLPRQVP